MYTKPNRKGLMSFREDIINYKAKIYAKGLIDSDRRKLEVYLLEYFAQADKDSKGTLTEEELIEALELCDKFKLIMIDVILLI